MAKMLSVFIWCLFATGNFADSQDWHFSGPNIAVHKNATQSPDTEWGPAGRAVDGNTNSDLDQNSCTHTAVDQHNEYASWTVDLNGIYTVSGIIIYNRNTLTLRLKNFQVIGDPGNVNLYNDTGKDTYKEAMISITVDGFRTYSSITVWLSAPSGHPVDNGPLLTLCEVKIYAACQAPTVSNGTYSPVHAGYGFGSVITVTCAEGYHIHGSNQSKCQGDGSWGDPNGNLSSFVTTPQCSLITCEWPSPFFGGQYDTKNENTKNENTAVSQVPYGTVIHASCNSDLYVFTGNRTRICREDGIWSGEAPACVALCNAPSVVHGRYEGNGSATPGLYEQGQQINITCDDGYELSTTSTERTCGEDHQWYGGDVTCNAKATNEQGGSAAVIAGSAAGAVIFIAVAVVLAVVIYRKRRALTNIEGVSKQDAARTTSEIGTPNPDGEYENVMESEFGEYENTIEMESINRDVENSQHEYESTVPANLKEHVYSDLNSSDAESKAEKVDSKNDYVNLNLNKK